MGAIALALVASTPLTQDRAARAGLCSLAVVLGCSAQHQRNTVRRLNAQLQDVDDISHDAYQRSIWHRLNPSNARIDVENTEALEAFDWQDLINYPDDFPHLLLLGKTGAGKTWLAERLLRLLGSGRILTPHRKPGDFKGFPLVGGGRDYPSINAALVALVMEMNERYQRMDKGEEAFPWLNVAIDEFPAIAANCPDATESIKTLIRESRKVKIRLILLSQGDEVKTLGIDGEGSLRDSMTYIRLRGFVIPHSKRLKNERITQMLKGQRYPCMVEDTIATTSTIPTYPNSDPELTRTQAGSNSAQFGTRTDHVNALKRAYNNSVGFPELAEFGNWASLTTGEKQTRISELRTQNLTQNQIIFVLWGAKAGDNRAYKKAVQEFKRLSQEPGGGNEQALP